MIHITLACNKQGFGQNCPYYQPKPDVPLEQIPAWIDATVAEHGWTTVDGKHFCPRHNPADIGVRRAIGREYTEIAPGVRARLPSAVEFEGMDIEVQLDQA